MAEMRLRILLLISLFGGTQVIQAQKPYAQKPGFDFATQLGVVSIAEGKPPCLDITNKTLTNGEKITLVKTTKPQSIAQAEIVKRLDGNCPVRASEDDPKESHYQLKLLKGSFDTSAIAFAIAKPVRSFVLKNGLVNVDLDGDGRTEYFRECTSSEGLHLSVWTGRLLNGQRRWHYYYYLGYDVEPSCKAKEAQGP
jgi:hypothetical protein